MSSIRPIITLAIILGVGVFMFMKVSESPIDPAQATGHATTSAPLAEVPPLTPTPLDAPAVPAPTIPAPTWGSESQPAPVPNQLVATPETSPIVPALPEVPQIVSSTPEPAPTAVPPVSQPIALPANIPTASYPGDAASTASTTPPTAATPPIPELPAPAAIATPTAQAGTDSESLAPITPVPSADDRYAMGATEPVQPAIPEPVAAEPPAPSTDAPIVAATPAATPSFTASWPEIQGALERQELAAAHEMLSRWYGDPRLTPAEKAQVDSLLGQLAGTVVYSTEHRLEPPYMVEAGDTLQTIADKCEVPWQLLAKINGVPSATAVQPGQQLKVVHGPFSAVVSLEQKEMTLLLDGRYAGRFPVRIEPTAPLSEGEWKLEQKLVNPTTAETGIVSASYAPAPVDRVLVLRNESPTAAGATISITSGESSPSGPTAVAPAAIRLSAQDVEEVADILSVGSTVTIRK